LEPSPSLLSFSCAKPTPLRSSLAKPLGYAMKPGTKAFGQSSTTACSPKHSSCTRSSVRRRCSSSHLSWPLYPFTQPSST
ncbi:hypothetical protein LTR16_011520, partial [Cryomyces antarcticus]